MKVFRSIDEFVIPDGAVVTTGTFDGVHRGHRRIIAHLNDQARRIKGESVLLTFHPHPRMVLFPDDHGMKLLTTMDERIALLEQAGVQNLIIQPFTRDFSRISSIDFIRDVLVGKLGTKILVIGYDHHFGRNREGSFEHLKETSSLYGFEVEEIPALDVDDVAISSTKIRHALEQGDVAMAEKYLSYPFSLTGTVVHGDELGRKIGFPTANIRVDCKHKLIPAIGVYACHVIVDEKKERGMLNIGSRPTVNGVEQTIEVHIFDLDKELYGQQLTVQLKGRIRDEKKFADTGQLMNRLKIDKVVANRML